MASNTSSLQHFFAVNAAAQYLRLDRRTLRRAGLEPAALLHLASNKTHPLFSQRQLDELGAKLAIAVKK